MDKLRAQIAAHPLPGSPYDKITFVRVNGQGKPLYRVLNGEGDVGAHEALKRAFALFGGRCFHCNAEMAPQPLSYEITRDHLRSRKDGGGNYLHNLVFACGSCNRRKGAADLISFNVERGAEYLNALEAHLGRCVDALGEAAPKG